MVSLRVEAWFRVSRLLLVVFTLVVGTTCSGSQGVSSKIAVERTVNYSEDEICPKVQGPSALVYAYDQMDAMDIVIDLGSDGIIEGARRGTDIFIRDHTGNEWVKIDASEENAGTAFFDYMQDAWDLQVLVQVRHDAYQEVTEAVAGGQVEVVLGDVEADVTLDETGRVVGWEVVETDPAQDGPPLVTSFKVLDAEIAKAMLDQRPENAPLLEDQPVVDYFDRLPALNDRCEPLDARRARLLECVVVEGQGKTIREWMGPDRGSVPSFSSGACPGS